MSLSCSLKIQLIIICWYSRRTQGNQEHELLAIVVVLETVVAVAVVALVVVAVVLAVVVAVLVVVTVTEVLV